MTLDDDNSVYVGGLPFDVTEDSIRKVFDLYGHVVAVKLNKDNGIAGKCYGFVTFTNPRSAVDAIQDMDGRMIDGRVVKVNEVRSRGPRSNFGRESFRRNPGRGRDREFERFREFDRDREFIEDGEFDQEYDRDQERDFGRDRPRERSRGQYRERSFGERERERSFGERERVFVDRKRERNGNHDMDMEENEQENERNFEHKRERNRSSDSDIRDQDSKSLTGSKLTDNHSKELPSVSSDKDQNQGEKGVDISKRKLKKLQNEVSHMEELEAERSELVSKLHERSKDLEDALRATKKLTLHRKMQLSELRKCFTHVEDYRDRLKRSELELQSLVDSTMLDIEEYSDDDADINPSFLANGNA